MLLRWGHKGKHNIFWKVIHCNVAHNLGLIETITTHYKYLLSPLLDYERGDLSFIPVRVLTGIWDLQFSRFRTAIFERFTRQLPLGSLPLPSEIINITQEILENQNFKMYYDRVTLIRTSRTISASQSILTC